MPLEGADDLIFHSSSCRRLLTCPGSQAYKQNTPAVPIIGFYSKVGRDHCPGVWIHSKQEDPRADCTGVLHDPETDPERPYVVTTTSSGDDPEVTTRFATLPEATYFWDSVQIGLGSAMFVHNPVTPFERVYAEKPPPISDMKTGVCYRVTNTQKREFYVRLLDGSGDGTKEVIFGPWANESGACIALEYLLDPNGTNRCRSCHFHWLVTYYPRKAKELPLLLWPCAADANLAGWTTHRR